MPAERVVSTKGPASNFDFGSARPDDLLRALLRLASRVDSSSDPLVDQPEAEEIVLDADVDGVRYLVVRLPAPSCVPVQLSPREQEIVRMVAEGHPNKVIAAILNISSWTVCTHLRRVFAKFGVGTRAAMVARYLENGAGNNRGANFQKSLGRAQPQ